MLQARHAMTILVAVLLSAFATATARAQTTAFTYQGQLLDAGAPASGVFDLRFRLFSAASGGTQVGSQLCLDNVTVAQGLFTVQIDFGQQFAAPQDRFLEIDVRRDTGLSCGSSVGFATLTPRQPVTPAPLANHARSAFALDAADGSPAGAVQVDAAGNVGIGTAAPTRRLSVEGDMEVGVGTADYHHLRIGGGNSDGFLYGSFPKFGDGIHIGYNFFADAAGLGHIINPGGGASRITMQYGAIHLATAPALGGEPVERLTVGTTGNVGLGTVAPASKLEVRGDIRLGTTGQLLAPGGEENLRIIRGNINGSGTITAGSGFTVLKADSGEYHVTFNTPFNGMPTITATPDVGAVCTYGAHVFSPSAGGVIILVRHDCDGANIGFQFIAVGPR